MLSLSIPLVPDRLSVACPVDLQRLLRAVASSTAIETGQSIQEIESQLLAASRFPTLDLASPVLA